MSAESAFVWVLITYERGCADSSQSQVQATRARQASPSIYSQSDFFFLLGEGRVGYSTTPTGSYTGRDFCTNVGRTFAHLCPRNNCIIIVVKSTQGPTLLMQHGSKKQLLHLGETTVRDRKSVYKLASCLASLVELKLLHQESCFLVLDILITLGIPTKRSQLTQLYKIQ